jgi:hypothetical protein
MACIGGGYIDILAGIMAGIYFDNERFYSII